MLPFQRDLHAAWLRIVTTYSGLPDSPLSLHSAITPEKIWYSLTPDLVISPPPSSHHRHHLDSTMKPVGEMLLSPLLLCGMVATAILLLILLFWCLVRCCTGCPSIFGQESSRARAARRARKKREKEERDTARLNERRAVREAEKKRKQREREERETARLNERRAATGVVEVEALGDVAVAA